MQGILYAVHVGLYSMHVLCAHPSMSCIMTAVLYANLTACREPPWWAHRDGLGSDASPG